MEPIAPNEVRGTTVEYKGKPYTLNFTQQNQLLAFLNQSRPIDQVPVERESPPFSQITIYRFNHTPDILILPIAFVDNELIFQDKETHQLYKDSSQGKLKTLLLQTYDP